jgi:MFS family permease
LFTHSLLPACARKRRAHYLFAAGLFGILGFHVGVWAVQLASLSAGLHLDPATLGAAITAAAAAGLATLFAGGALADRVGRRPVLAIGFAGSGTAFVLLALAGSLATLLPAVLLYGLAISFVDLGANTVGSAYEQAYAVTAMTGLHAWFSAGALTGAIGSAAALSAGVSYRGVYLALAALMAAALLAALLAAIPAPPGDELDRDQQRRVADRQQHDPQLRHHPAGLRNQLRHLSQCFWDEPGEDLWHSGVRRAPRDRPAGHAFEGFVAEGKDEVTCSAPAAFVEAVVHAVHVHQLGDPR